MIDMTMGDDKRFNGRDIKIDSRLVINDIIALE